MVFAVDRRPLTGDHARGQPQPETEKVAGDRMQVQCAVRLVPMQVNGYADDRDVRHHQRVQHDLPPRPVQQAMGNEIKREIQQSHTLKTKSEKTPDSMFGRTPPRRGAKGLVQDST
ncbi:hypothetical protein DFQ30_003097 [Apophysomyces sp. BC1015]|nr:hypothetical protein DFQ30_003097 [Apophysomyces sp. BC1015]